MDKNRTIKLSHGVLLTLLAVIFTIGLTFGSVELPRLADKLLDKNIDFLDVATGQNEITDYKTELFLSHYNIRLIGYISLGLILILIIAGFVLEKQGLVSAGAIVLFLPVFGHFAATMFFLGGLAFLRFLWLPFLDISFDIMRLGDIILLPYRWLIDGGALIDIRLWKVLPFIITGLGLFIFLLGVLAWMYGRMRNKPVTDFWIYRISRHPQYLGWIIWSYGILFLPGANMKRYVDVPNSLPWLLATMVIIGVALMEERKMKRDHGDSYESFRHRTPFLFPLPRFIRKIFSLPLRILFKKEYPDRKREIVTVIAFYTLLCVLLSAFSSGLIHFKRKDSIESEQHIGKLVHTIRTTINRAEMRNAARSLADIGGSAVDSLIVLIKHENVFIRWYCADVMGRTKSEKVVQPLLKLMDDPDQNVRRVAVSSLGETGLKQVVPSLIKVYLDQEKGVGSDAARALGKLGSSDAIPHLIKGLKNKDRNTARWSSWALGEIGAKEAVKPLIVYLEQENCDYYQVGTALQKLGSEKAADAYIAGLNDENDWWIQTACITALGELKSEKGIQALINALKGENDRIRRAAVLALSGYKSDKVVAALQEIIHDEDWEVRLYAQDALKKIGTPEALQALKEQR